MALFFNGLIAAVRMCTTENISNFDQSDCITDPDQVFSLNIYYINIQRNYLIRVCNVCNDSINCLWNGQVQVVFVSQVINCCMVGNLTTKVFSLICNWNGDRHDNYQIQKLLERDNLIALHLTVHMYMQIISLYKPVKFCSWAIIFDTAQNDSFTINCLFLSFFYVFFFLNYFTSGDTKSSMWLFYILLKYVYIFFIFIFQFLNMIRKTYKTVSTVLYKTPNQNEDETKSALYSLFHIIKKLKFLKCMSGVPLVWFYHILSHYSLKHHLL